MNKARSLWSGGGGPHVRTQERCGFGRSKAFWWVKMDFGSLAQSMDEDKNHWKKTFMFDLSECSTSGRDYEEVHLIVTIFPPNLMFKIKSL